MPKVIVETRTRGSSKTGKGDVVQSRVHLDVHNIDDKTSPSSVSARGGTVTYLVDASDLLSG